VGNHAWTVGNVRITRIVEREVLIGLAELLPEATPRALARHRAWLEPHPISSSRTTGSRMVADIAPAPPRAGGCAATAPSTRCS